MCDVTLVLPEGPFRQHAVRDVAGYRNEPGDLAVLLQRGAADFAVSDGPVLGYEFIGCRRNPLPPEDDGRIGNRALERFGGQREAPEMNTTSKLVVS